jgi:hypothetical protein
MSYSTNISPVFNTTAESVIQTSRDLLENQIHSRGGSNSIIRPTVWVRHCQPFPGKLSRDINRADLLRTLQTDISILGELGRLCDHWRALRRLMAA